MKVILCVLLAVCTISITQGAQFLTQCNDGEPEQECSLRVAAEFQNKCMKIIPGAAVSIQTCDTPQCGQNTKLIDGDKTKPYPDCCSFCAIDNPNQPASSSMVG